MNRQHINLIIFVLIILTASAVSARTRAPFMPGGAVISGEASYSHYSGDLFETNGEGISALSVSPTFSFFVSRGFAVGGELRVARLSQAGTRTTNWLVGPRLIYYVVGEDNAKNAKGKAVPYLFTSFLFGQTITQERDLDLNNSLIRFGGGVNYMLTTSVGLFGEGAYERQTTSLKEQSQNSYAHNSGKSISLFLGFAIFLWE